MGSGWLALLGTSRATASTSRRSEPRLRTDHVLISRRQSPRFPMSTRLALQQDFACHREHREHRDAQLKRFPQCSLWSLWLMSPGRTRMTKFDSILVHNCLWTRRNRIEAERLDTRIQRLPTRAATDLGRVLRRAESTPHALRSFVCDNTGGCHSSGNNTERMATRPSPHERTRFVFHVSARAAISDLITNPAVFLFHTFLGRVCYIQIEQKERQKNTGLTRDFDRLL